jgi:hypothetical protein
MSTMAKSLKGHPNKLVTCQCMVGRKKLHTPEDRLVKNYETQGEDSACLERGNLI